MEQKLGNYWGYGWIQGGCQGIDCDSPDEGAWQFGPDASVNSGSAQMRQVCRGGSDRAY